MIIEIQHLFCWFNINTQTSVQQLFFVFAILVTMGGQKFSELALCLSSYHHTAIFVGKQQVFGNK